MDVYRLLLAFMALGFTATVAVPATYISEAVDFTNALEVVSRHKATLNQSMFCAEVVEDGSFKIACRIKEQPAFVFLYCQYYFPFEDPDIPNCIVHLNAELDALKALKNAGIKTVTFYQDVIMDVKCPEEPDSLRCGGLLEVWVDNSEAMFDKLPSSDFSTVIKSSSCESLSITIYDLRRIIEYMETKDTVSNSYTLIRDFQGFLRYSGGFIICDPILQEVTELGDLSKGIINQITNLTKEISHKCQELVTRL